MPLVEAVTIEIGAAIAKSILKLWLKDFSLGQDVSLSLIDLLKSRTLDTFAQRKGQRQFEEIGDRVGESLFPLFEIEGARLDEGSRISVALAVAEAFNKSKLSSELLAARNLEPKRLAAYVLVAHPSATRHFSTAETAFYQRIIEESCAYIVDIASQLPAFTEQSFAEVLKREDQLIAIANQILQESRQIREQLDPMAEAGRFEIDYRLAVARNLDILQLVGADVSLANRRHRLSIAYIALSVQQSPQLLFEIDNHTDTETANPLKGSRDEIDRDILAVDEALTRSRRLLIRGLAGSGKTTSLQWIAVRSATRSFQGHLSGWNDTLPFHIRLRHCVQSGLPRPEDFPGLVAPAIADAMPKGWAHTALKSGRAIVLVDGVDEVPASQREDVRTWLKELVETFPQARFIVTSRPHAVVEGWMDREGFSDAELQPMELTDIYSFIDHWHNAVREELHEDEERVELESLAEFLKDDMRRNRSIRNLATNPLLCAMLCALNRDRRRQLPADRIELYEACCYLLLERRDKERRIELTDYPTLNYRQKRLLLEDLAYWMIKNEWSEVALDLVNDRFTRKLANMQGVSQNAPEICRLFVERAGIIREPVAGKIDFMHRTFQEFLAAKAAVDEMDNGVLVKNAHNDQWREVIILSSGLAAKQMREDLIKNLIVRGDKEKDHRYQLHLLAVSCLETSLELGQEVKVEVEKRLKQLVPPKKMTDAKALASAGELAVKYLAKSGKYSASTTAACVRTLSLIRSETALEMLEGYAEDTRAPVLTELLGAWDSFDRETYARRVLSRTLQSTSNLRLKPLPSLDGIQYFTSLTSLSLSGYQQVSALSSLAGLTQLTSLDLSYCDRVSDFTPLAGLPQLTSLNLSCCDQLSDLNPLAGLTQLTSLDLSGCDQLRDLTPLSGLTQLRSLNLSSCTQLGTLTLAGLTQLTSLDLSGCNQLSTLILKDLTHLTSLNLFACSQLRMLNLENLTQLQSLKLLHCSRLDALSLTGLIQLGSLSLSSCPHLDILNLMDLTQLESLNLSGCSNLITLNLTDLTRLSILNLFQCPLLSTLSLEGSNQLTTLDLSRCSQLSDLSLKGLNRLTSLDLSGCSQLYDLSELMDLNNLEEPVLCGIPHELTMPQGINKKKVRIVL